MTVFRLLNRFGDIALEVSLAFGDLQKALIHLI